jgi:hypothetical protein
MVHLTNQARDSIFTREGFSFGVGCECDHDLVLSFLRWCKDIGTSVPSASYRHVRFRLKNLQMPPLIICCIEPEQVCNVGSIDAVY